MERTKPLRPGAEAIIRGGADNPTISGTLSLTQTPQGVLVMADIAGLPTGMPPCAPRIFALHIHEGGDCGGENFADSGGHWNPNGCLHPYHAGDLPPLFGNHGRAFLAVLTDRFALQDAVGHTVIIHSDRDDFTTQPSGDSGQKIACGVIHALP